MQYVFAFSVLISFFIGMWFERMNVQFFRYILSKFKSRQKSNKIKEIPIKPEYLKRFIELLEEEKKLDNYNFTIHNKTVQMDRKRKLLWREIEEENKLQGRVMLFNNEKQIIEVYDR